MGSSQLRRASGVGRCFGSLAGNFALSVAFVRTVDGSGETDLGGPRGGVFGGKHTVESLAGKVARLANASLSQLISATSET